MSNSKQIFEGWTVQDFIDDLDPVFTMIMNGKSWLKPFKTEDEIKKWCTSEQPGYKRPIKEVYNHFIKKANL